MSEMRWTQNIEKTIALGVPHISSYALTVEPNTALKYFIYKAVIPPVDDDLAKLHYDILLQKTAEAGFDNYEFSNFGKSGYFSQNNTAYWTGKFYLGIGPSAHSFIENTRSWNVKHNIKYIKAINTGELPQDNEVLSKTDTYNEYVMTRLRTKWGANLQEIEDNFGLQFKTYLLQQAELHFQNGLLEVNENSVKVTKTGKFLTDGIAADLFKLNLK